jgi:metabolite-proton symporter
MGEGMEAHESWKAGTAMTAGEAPKTVNSPRQVLFASLVGTTIEFFDFYIYATAAALVFPKLFFPSVDPSSAILASWATFAVAFFARPIGSAVFGHFGDRVGRKTTLVLALGTMGVSTVGVGLLPTYGSIGIAAPILLALCRFGQGIGLGGEWGGAVLLAVENAPPGKRAWYGMFPQLGAPIGLALSNGVFLLLSSTLGDKAFFSYGWRLPFLASSGLVFVGLYVRLTITETPVFEESRKHGRPVSVPAAAVFGRHFRQLAAGTLLCLSTFVLFYLMIAFAPSWAMTALHIPRARVLEMQLATTVCFALMIPVSALLAERGRKRTMLWITAAIGLFGLVLAPMFEAGQAGAFAMMAVGLALMGMTYGPLGTVVAELFPTPVRYSGSSLAFNFAGVLGASLTPYAATWLAPRYGLRAVGFYLLGAAVLTMVGLLMIRESSGGVLSEFEEPVV